MQAQSLLLAVAVATHGPCCAPPTISPLPNEYFSALKLIQISSLDSQIAAKTHLSPSPVLQFEATIALAARGL